MRAHGGAAFWTGSKPIEIADHHSVYCSTNILRIARTRNRVASVADSGGNRRRWVGVMCGQRKYSPLANGATRGTDGVVVMRRGVGPTP